jgi:glycosyltransferase involved in cell wall biosynthesis
VIHTETGMASDEVASLKPVRLLLRRAATHKVSAVVVPSRALEQIAVTGFGLRAPVIRIPNGVDVRVFQPSDGSVMRSQLGLERSAFVVGCVGHLRAEKGHLRLLNAFHAAAIPNSRLLIVGEGAMRSVIERRINDLGIGNQVIFAGRIDDVRPWYAAMDVFALPSDTEQMPMALLEAMACGLPAVCTDVGDCREIIGAQLLPAIFHTDDIGGFAEALRAFSRDERLRSETGTRNRRRCIDEYDSKEMIARYRELYNRTISAARRTQTVPAV